MLTQWCVLEFEACVGVRVCVWEGVCVNFWGISAWFVCDSDWKLQVGFSPAVAGEPWWDAAGQDTLFHSTALWGCWARGMLASLSSGSPVPAESVLLLSRLCFINKHKFSKRKIMKVCIWFVFFSFFWNPLWKKNISFWKVFLFGVHQLQFFCQTPITDL